jgi:Mce-associated membrane protein
VEDQPADSGDLTTDPESPAQPAVAESTTRRRWGFGRRRAKTSETQAAPVDEPDETSAQQPPAPRTPVGKAKRPGKAAVEAEPTDEPTDEVEETGEGSEAVEVEEAEVILVPHKPAGKRVKIAAVAAGVLFVGAAAFAGSTVQPYLADRALVDTKLDVARTARDAITTLWTYTPDNMDSLPDRASRYLGGDFANEYRKYIDAIVAPNKQAQVTNTTDVMGAAVESIGPTEATALVYTNSVATSPVTKNIPSLRYLSYRLTMQRHDAKWLITKMSTVTSFDLTPQL